MRPPLAADTNSVAAIATVAAAAVTGLVTWLLGRRSQTSKEASGAYGQLWQLYQDRKGEIADLKIEIAADKKECQDEIAALRRTHDAELDELRRDCSERVAAETRRAHAEVTELERKMDTRLENYRRDRDYWRAKAEGRLNGGKDDSDTPPPPNR